MKLLMTCLLLLTAQARAEVEPVLHRDVPAGILQKSILRSHGNSQMVPNAEGFFQPHLIPVRPAGFERALKATPRSPGRCTGAFVSVSGYKLTALHCVSKCLEVQGKLKFYSSQGVRIGVPLTRAPEVYCEGEKVVRVGKGDIEYGASVQGLEKVQLTEKEWYDQSEDFALIKMDTAPACFTTQENLKFDEDVWAIGFPLQVNRRNGHSSLGDRQYVSYGKYREKVARVDLPYPELMTSEDREAYEKGRAEKGGEKVFYDSNYLISDVDLYGGNSGGPLINRTGQLLGINSFGTMGELITGQKFTVFAGSISIARIKKSLSTELGESETAKIFDCQQ